MKKQKLREIYLQKRKELSNEEKEKLQQSIYQQIFDLDLNHIKNVHLFLSLQKFNEINTQPIIDYLRNQNKKILIKN